MKRNETKRNEIVKNGLDFSTVTIADCDSIKWQQMIKKFNREQSGGPTGSIRRQHQASNTSITVLIINQQSVISETLTRTGRPDNLVVL